MTRSAKTIEQTEDYTMSRKVVISLSGNVGKTTVSVQLLAPRTGDKLISVETINADAAALGVDAEKIRGEHFAKIIKQLALEDNLLIDVGASNAEEFLTKCKQLEGQEEVDQWLIPVTPDQKMLTDTAKLIEILADDMGVPGEKIVVLPNRTRINIDDVREEFEPLIKFHGKNKGKFAFALAAAIPENEAYSLAARKGATVDAVATDATDYKAAARAAVSDKERDKALDMFALVKMAKSAKRDLDRSFAALFNVTVE